MKRNGQYLINDVSTSPSPRGDKSAEKAERQEAGLGNARENADVKLQEKDAEWLAKYNTLKQVHEAKEQSRKELDEERKRHSKLLEEEKTKTAKLLEEERAKVAKQVEEERAKVANQMEVEKLRATKYEVSASLLQAKLESKEEMGALAKEITQSYERKMQEIHKEAQVEKERLNAELTRQKGEEWRRLEAQYKELLAQEKENFKNIQLMQKEYMDKYTEFCKPKNSGEEERHRDKNRDETLRMLMQQHSTVIETLTMAPALKRPYPNIDEERSQKRQHRPTQDKENETPPRNRQDWDAAKLQEVQHWSAEEVGRFAAFKSLPKAFCELLIEKGIDGDCLVNFTEEDFASMQISEETICKIKKKRFFRMIDELQNAQKQIKK